MSDPLYSDASPPPPPSGGEEPLLEGLNEPQREAVTAPPGPLLVVAGAGTGKTRVLTRRVAWKVHRGAAPRAVLAITFTNKAADVLKQRLGALPGGGAVTAGTFHAFCALLLRRYADRIGGTRDFTILDEEDRSRLLRDLLDDLKIDPTAYRPDAFAAGISHQKNGGAGRAPPAFSDPRFLDHLARVAPAYGKRLRVAGLYDFDDLLLEGGRLLRESADAAVEVRERWRHVLVDEYQDTNGVQFDLLKALTGPDPAPDITVVGDPDQSIYRWRGASIRNILRFQEDFPGARVVKLEENYRSSRRILAAAEAVIARNQERYEKRLWTRAPDGDRVTELRFADPTAEGTGVARLVASWRDAGLAWSEIAVFVRVNHASRTVETGLRNAGVPYAMVSGVEFFQRREVKDVLAYARLLENPRDEAAFARVVNAPRRGVGDGSIEKIRAHATARGISVPEAAAERVEGVPARARAGLDRFLACLARLRLLPRSPLGPLFQAVVTETGYREDLLSREDDLERSRVENVDELVAAAHEADRTTPGLTLREFLERSALVSDQDAWDDRSGRVSVMTVHAAKGLEFDGVVVVGAEEGFFPHARSQDRPEDLEEERRLFYVAMTRARRRLAVTHVAQREGWRGIERRQPSRFLADVPEALVETRDATGLYLRDHARAQARAREGVRRPSPWSVDEAPAGLDAEAPVAPAAEPVFDREGGDDVPRPGDRVAHPYFGEGVLLSSSGSGAQRRVTVAFDAAGTKTILWTYARLERLPGPGAKGGTP
jgi:DNA helicase-2/ATP-dependent DNA helicase PcrA